MFGMQDPSQTLTQIERYMQEGRLEISEVMATQFCDMMLGKRKRDAQQQIFLLKGLRLMCDVYLIRNKADQSLSTIKRMHSERKSLTKLLQKHAPDMLISMSPAHEDYLRAGRLYAAAGKKGAAKKAFATCESQRPGHLSAALAVAQYMTTKAHIARLLNALSMAGSLVLSNGVYRLQPEGSPVVLLDEMMSGLEQIASASPTHATDCQEAIQGLATQRTAIEQGEQAANAALQSALDNLKPKHDYYQYG